VREAGYRVEPIPGPSALTTALSVAGFAAVPFAFNGFLPPRAAARRAALERFRDAAAAQVFFETPHRIVEALEDLAAVFGRDRRITIARELTKRFESVHTTTLGEALEWIAADTDRKRGEFVLIVEGAPAHAKADGDDAPGAAEMRVFDLLREAMPASRAAKLAAEITGKSRDAFYRTAIGAKGEPEDG
jgi:16S rRNA (cytidine1402-2'-O)-methyltransferase